MINAPTGEGCLNFPCEGVKRLPACWGGEV